MDLSFLKDFAPLLQSHPGLVANDLVDRPHPAAMPSSGGFDALAGGPEAISQSLMPGARPVEPPPMSPAGPMVPPQAASGADRFAQILRYAVPALATLYALKQGSGLGSFAEGYMKAEDMRGDQADRQDLRHNRQEQLRLEQARVNEEVARSAREQAREERIAAQQAAERARVMQENHDKVIHDALQRALDKATENPDFMQKVNKMGPDSFSLQVPGLGNVPLSDAFNRLGVIKGPGGYAYGKGPDDPLVPFRVDNGDATTEELIPRSEAAKRGKHVVSRPSPKDTKQRTSIRAFDDPEGGPKKYYLVDDATGDVMREVKPPDAAASHASTAKYAVGQSVKLKSGKVVKIKQINPDGTFLY